MSSERIVVALPPPAGELLGWCCPKVADDRIMLVIPGGHVWLCARHWEQLEQQWTVPEIVAADRTPPPG